MITISTRDYTVRDLRILAHALQIGLYEIYRTPECTLCSHCSAPCDLYTLCTDLNNTCRYLSVKLKERETLELHRNQKESE